jgi:hypothetical protein
MEAIFGLLKYDAALATHGLIGYFHAPIRGQAVHDYPMGWGGGNEFGVDLAGGKNLHALRFFAFLPHVAPSVGVNNIRSANRRRGIAGVFYGWSSF